MTALITAENISLQANDKTILENISMTLNRDEILTIIGPNGAGKSTLVRILIGLIKPTTGKVSYSRKLRFGYMPQQIVLNDFMPLTVKAFLALAHNKSAHCAEIFAQLNIDSILQQSMHKLSGGERQRVLLARAMIQEPDILVLDEPAQGVDITGQNRLYELIDQVRKIHQCAVLMVSHDLHLVMAKTDRVICLNQHICCHGHPDSVSTDDAYLSLFDDKLQALAPYTHHHDHHHDLHGEVIEGEHSSRCDHDH
jgi:zinc transport system ATP-binding protein